MAAPSSVTPVSAPAAEAHTYREKVRTWKVNPKGKGRQYIVLTIPYREARQITEVVQYDDKRGRGEQRGLIAPWVATLRSAYVNDDYTPAAWYACLTPAIEKGLKFEGKNDKNVILTIPEGEQLPLIDGQQRNGALDRLYSEAEGRDDQAALMTILDTDVTLIVYLTGDAKDRRANFLHLQEGKPVSRQLLQTLRVRASDDPTELFAYQTAKALAANNQSHLFQLVGFGNDTAQISVHTITTSGGSESATSIYGGAEIARHYGLTTEWLVNTYIEAYQAIVSRAGTVEMDDGLGGKQQWPSLFLDKFPLTPLGQWSGSKGGSALIIGVGNMLAYLKGLQEHHGDATDDDLDELVRACNEVFASPLPNGLSAPDKRRLMGDFARSLFHDFLLEDGDEPQEGLLASDDGIPKPLTDLLSRSTFGLRRAESKAKVKANADADGETDDQPLGLDQQMALDDQEKAKVDAEKKAKAADAPKATRRKAKPELAGAMG